MVLRELKWPDHATAEEPLERAEELRASESCRRPLSWAREGSDERETGERDTTELMQPM